MKVMLDAKLKQHIFKYPIRAGLFQFWMPILLIMIVRLVTHPLDFISTPFETEGMEKLVAINSPISVALAGYIWLKNKRLSQDLQS